MNNLIYQVNEHPRKWYEWILYTLQMLLSVFVATVLIANICGTPIPSCLIGAGVGTLIYQFFTKFKSPMFISSCGATVSAVVGALALGGGNNYIAVAIGGAVILVVYGAFALLVHFFGKKLFERIFPAIIVGPVTMVIGLNLAGFLPTYIGIDWIPMVVAVVTMIATALITHYCKGFIKTISFLIGLGIGYVLAIILEASSAYDFGIFAAFQGFEWFNPDSFAFMQWGNSPFEAKHIIDVIILFLPVSICAALEHYSDHKVLSNIIGTDLTLDPGMSRTLLGDGVASTIGTIIGGLPNTSYGESIAAIGFSRVASVWISTATAVVLIGMGFFAPITVFISSIPSAVFGGVAMILYGYIAASGLKTLLAAKPDLEEPKNLIVVSVILTVGVSGLFLWSASFTGVALAMVLGVLLNLILKNKKK